MWKAVCRGDTCPVTSSFLVCHPPDLGATLGKEAFSGAGRLLRVEGSTRPGSPLLEQSPAPPAGLQGWPCAYLGVTLLGGGFTQSERLLAQTSEKRKTVLNFPGGVYGLRESWKVVRFVVPVTQRGFPDASDAPSPALLGVSGCLVRGWLPQRSGRWREGQVRKGLWPCF